MRRALLLVLIALPAFAGEVVCDPPGSSSKPCSPPATYVAHSAANPNPFDAPVKFGGAITIEGRILWQWIKAGEMSKPCTPAQISERFGVYARACAAKVGDVLYITFPFRVVP